MPISRRLFLSGISSAAAALLIGCDTNSNTSESSVFTLRIAETTDVHGNIFPYNFATGAENKTNSLSHLYSFIEKQRQNASASDGKEYFMLVDNGDNLQGEPILNIYNDGLKNSTLDKHIVTDVYNFMGCEVGVVGNHDIEFGKKVYDNLKENFNFPLLAANAVKQGTQNTQDKVKPGNGTRKPYFAYGTSNGAYTIKTFPMINQPDIKVAILGLSTPESKVFLANGDENEDMYFEDMVESAAYWIEKIKEENVDCVVGMCHAGFNPELAPGQNKDTYRNYNPVQLIAQQVAGFDVIFWGHDHLIQEEVYVNGVLLLGGNHYARALNMADIEFTYDNVAKKYNIRKNGFYLKALKNENNSKILGTIVDAKGEKIGNEDTMELVPQASFMAQFQTQLDSAKAKFTDAIIGELTTSISTKDAVFGDSAFNDLVHNLEKYAANKEFGIDVDMTIAAPLKYSFANDNYELSGTLTYADMWNLYFYDNLHAVIEMSGQEIKDYLEYTFGMWFNEMQDENDDLLNLKSAEVAKHSEYKKTNMIYWDMDTFAGIVYELDVSKPKGNRVTISGLDNNFDGQVDGIFDLNKKYKISVNSYRYGGGGGHFKAIGIDQTKMKERTLFYSATGLRDYLISYIQDENNGSIAPQAIGNWKIIPESWAAKGRIKNEPEIFWAGATGR